jgi:hypothetical protein
MALTINICGAFTLRSRIAPRTLFSHQIGTVLA